MTSHSNHASAAKWIGLGAASALIVAVSLTAGGCGKEQPQQQVVAPPPPPPPPPPPKVKTVAELMAEMNIDPRVKMSEEKAPSRTEQRRIVLEFFDAVCRGDDKTVAPMLSEADRDSLGVLVASGKWKKSTASIKQLEIQTGPNPSGEPCALAIIETGATTFQAQMWQYTLNPDGTASFNAIATPPNIMNLLSGGDWITAWYGVLDKELALADKPDEEIVVPKSDKSSESSSGGAEIGAGPSTSPGNSPGFPGKRSDRGRRFQRPGP